MGSVYAYTNTIVGSREIIKMQFLYYKNKIMNTIRGNLPSSIFTWYIIMLASILLSACLISYWYYEVYNIMTNDKHRDQVSEEYEPLIDITELDDIVHKYDL